MAITATRDVRFQSASQRSPTNALNAVEAGAAEFTLNDLPPLPTPDRQTMRSQAASGCTVVLMLIAVLAGLPHSVGNNYGGPWEHGNFRLRQLGLVALYIEAFFAILCLLGIMWGDPGVLKRSPETCFPLPQNIAEKLRQKQSLAGLENVYEGQHVFCVRCCIWRPDSSPPLYRDNTHHCSTCQRCVADFDHHCGVFGRCIAGKGWQGNMGYFKGILMMMFFGLITCIGTVAATAGAL